MKMREAVVAAIKRDPDLVPKLTGSLRERIGDAEGRMSTVVQAAEAIEPILADAVKKRPSRLGKFGLKSAQVLAQLTMEDDRSNRRLVKIARGSTIGIVFADIAGFTNYTERVGDAEAIKLLAKLSETVDVAVAAGKGECVKGLGDGYLMAFPSASQAVTAAVTLRDKAEREHAAGTFPVHLRVAVHAGEPLVEQDDLLGHDVNLTARLLDECKPGAVLVSEAAKELAERRLKTVRFVKGRRVKIRGLTSKVVVFDVERVRESQRLNS